MLGWFRTHLTVKPVSDGLGLNVQEDYWKRGKEQLKERQFNSGCSQEGEPPKPTNNGLLHNPGCPPNRILPWPCSPQEWLQGRRCTVGGDGLWGAGDRNRCSTNPTFAHSSSWVWKGWIRNHYPGFVMLTNSWHASETSTLSGTNKKWTSVGSVTSKFLTPCNILNIWRTKAGHQFKLFLLLS